MDDGLIQLEDEQIRDKEFVAQCIDRRLFIKQLLMNNLLDNSEVIDIINLKNEKEKIKESQKEINS